MEYYFLIFPPIIGTFVYIGAQILIFRTGKFRLFGSALVGMPIGFTGMLVFQVLPAGRVFAGSDDVALLAANMIVYVSFVYTYYHFLRMGETARRIRFLFELVEAGDTGISGTKLYASYGSREMIDRRLDRLLSYGQIGEQDGRIFALNTRVLWISKAIKALKKLLSV